MGIESHLMKTALLSTSYLGDNRGQNGGADAPRRLATMIKFVEYYHKHTPQWDIHILDNVSPGDTLGSFVEQATYINIINADKHYDRPTPNDYLYAWRALYYIQNLLEDYDKVIHMENDLFIVSKKMVNYIDNLNTGWTGIWIPQHNHPEVFHVVVKDDPVYMAYVADKTIFDRNGNRMEDTMGHSHINKDLYGQRFGEWPANKKATVNFNQIDFYAQARLEDKMPDELH